MNELEKNEYGLIRLRKRKKRGKTRSRDQSKDPEILAAMALRKAQNENKRVIAKARRARDIYSELDTINVGDATLRDLVDDYAILKEAFMEDNDSE